MNELTQEQKTWGMVAHLSALVGFVIPFGNVLGPLVVWLIKKDTMPFVDDQGKEALNFNIAVAIVVAGLMVVGTVLLVVLVGFLFYIAAAIVGVAALVFMVIAGIKANEGVSYRYPYIFRLIKKAEKNRAPGWMLASSPAPVFFCPALRPIPWDWGRVRCCPGCRSAP
jgi:uncharacterized Tic20 family protein